MLMNPVNAAVAPRGRTILLSSVSSDSHTWNLVFLQLLLEETGHRVINLGACVADELLVQECSAIRPDLVVISTVNGHGQVDGLRLIRKLRSDPETRDTPVVIGGKLGITGGAEADDRARRLVSAGFSAVFQDDAEPTEIGRFLASLGHPAPRHPVATS